ncbi:uncharacterized protein SPAPADRAFT_54079 [Spathaspora passalidarum NRRL Y-27907]|uniref:Phytanoyl-CoA dioxygenase n=1 Tax=Spathaspora passalidarum (strain NRRL Y-27907 / 11-Y1) TaxID=619300 RepID=G3AIY2_SPAPN|nr:uncharacterized protein SPAPADRAFT_54079 [Spathaspora passalidarum NRRL Y-27907]EGW33793.1 hypothetical protein SPAPADRAFT_54079 [Spathaspora passalidarum NRRL Y-27907]
MPGLTTDQLETFQREGLLCIPDFLTPDQTTQLVSHAKELLAQCDLSKHPRTQFKTDDNDHIGDAYFFDSSDKISFFFDTDAFDDSGNLKFPLDKAINKIGHGLHIHDAVFHDVTFDQRVKDIARSLQYVDPKVLQSMLIFKQPTSQEESERDNAVPPHTDATFLYTTPQSAIGFWFALEDCTIENGCLSYSPATHLTHDITKRFVKIEQGRKGCGFVKVDGEEKPDDGEYKLVPCKAGSLVLIHNSVLHKSEKNRSDKSRYAYAFHVIDGTAKYDELNWLQVPPTSKNGTEFTKLYHEN